jgi:hypothetical protein
MKLHLAAVACLLVVAASLGGCATITKGHTQGFTVKTDPPGAECEITKKGAYVGVINPTPGTLQLQKGAAALNVACKKDGHLDASGTASSSVQGWTFGNLLVGGVIGFAVDAGSGAMHEYQTEMSLRLLPARFDSEASRELYFSAWKADIGKQFEQTREQVRSKCARDQCDKLLSAVNVKEEEALREAESGRKAAKITPSTANIGPSASASTATIPPLESKDRLPASNAIVLPPEPLPDPALIVRVGDKWRYKLSDRGRALGSIAVEVIQSGDQLVRERFTRDGYADFSAERQLRVAFNPSQFQTPISFPGGYQLPELSPYLDSGAELHVGQHWDNVSGVFFMPHVGKKTLVARVQVFKQESVHVPAGTFMAWRVDAESEENSTTPGVRARVRCSYWYAPEVRRTVKMTLDSIVSISAHSTTETYELVSFDLGK